MSDAAADLVNPVVSLTTKAINGATGALLGPGGGDAAPAPVDPQTRYLAKPRAAGASEGRARVKLEEEKRRRYADYQQTLLGGAGLGGDVMPDPAGIADIAGGY